ncbi:insulinase family protein [Undibacterium seohonense]|uniref:Insulinase family protein n=1 Tax=Undibacterium seohonense TaxID=1344950 RepID=A0ABR6X6V4_9BURK|nr:M16 family metallopeptidase [Undibacterium seohonense]MBC3808482.1 insulinase family protein [Undibacterium seohonense]
MRIITSQLLLLAALFASATFDRAHAVDSSSKYPASADIPYSSKLIKGKFANGLTYYIQKNTKPEQKAELRLVIKAGSILEDDDQQGLAHFTEHMAFNGSTHFQKNELVSFLESIGVKFGADLNAYTSFDETVYILPIPTDKPEHLETGVMVLADWAQGLRFDHTEIDRERGVVLEETRLGKGAGDRLQKQTLPKILHGSKYADRLPIGKEEILKTFSYEALKRFYRDWYRPDLMAVVVVGDVDPVSVKSVLEKHFAGLKNPSKPRTREIATLPLKNVNEALIATDKEANISAVSISQARFLSKNDGKFGSYRQRRIQTFFNTMLNNRLRELAQLPTPPFLGAGSGIKPVVAEYQELNSTAAIGKAGVQAAIDALVQENNRVAQFGFTQAEFERAKANALRGMENVYNERDKTQSADLAAEFIRNFLIGESIPGVEQEYVFHKDIVSQISLDDVNRFAQSVLNKQAPKLIIYQGSDKPDHVIPDNKKLLAMVAAAEQKPVLPFTEKSVTTSLFDTPPKAGVIVNEHKNAQLGTTEWTLSNGVKIVLKPTDFKSDQILLNATRAGGTGLIADADFLQARYATTVVGAMGVKDISPIELGKYLAGKSASVSTSFGENAEGISGASNKQDLETMLQVLSLALTAPRRDPALFQSFIGKQQDALRNQMATPFAVFQEQFIQATYPPHRRIPVVAKPEHIAQLDLDRLMALYQSRFSSAKGFTFFLVGSFDIEKIKPLLLTYLGSLPTHDIEIGVKDHGLRPVRGIVKKDVYIGKEQQSMVTLQLHGERAMPLSERLRFDAMIEVLQLRLTAKMREEMGAVYSPRVNASMRLIPYQGYAIVLGLPSGPENVDKLLRSSFDLIEQMKAAPASEDELNKVKENWLKNRKESLKTNGFWLATLSNALQQQEDPAHIFSFEERVKSLTTKDIQEAAKIYLDINNYIQVVMYPEKSK